ncbi:MAG: Fe-S cluster assembly protein SufB [Pirellulaceae bacterium]|nr:Fe-S cluster assembly protein SufB [Pirellulaceae bacterium]
MKFTGITAAAVREISALKAEPPWMCELRLKGLAAYLNHLAHRSCGDPGLHDLGELDYYQRAIEHKTADWRDLPEEMRRTYERLGLVATERDDGVGIQAQYDSEVVYGSRLESFDRHGIIFTDTDTALRQYPDLVRKYFGAVVKATDNRFAALNFAMWSGGVFVYLPAGTAVELPLHGYYHVHTPHFGQFEHTIIVLEEDATLDYVEACSSRAGLARSLHAGVVEIVLGPRARCRFSSIQNWAGNFFSLATRQAKLDEQATIQWIGGNLGSRVTMSYPSVRLQGHGARAELLSLSVAGAGQHQDTGAQVLHAACDTSCKILSKSIAKDGGRTTFRGRVQVLRGSRRARSHVCCDSMILDAVSRCDTYPVIEVRERDAVVEHEASISKIATDQLFYLRSRGLTENEANEMIIVGFLEPLLKELPMCYAVPLNQLIRLEMSRAVG